VEHADFVPRNHAARQRRPIYDPTGVVRLDKKGAELLFEWVVGSPRVFHLTCTEPTLEVACSLTRERETVDAECERMVLSVVTDK